jgi:hypothetical protein
LINGLRQKRQMHPSLSITFGDRLPQRII